MKLFAILLIAVLVAGLGSCNNVRAQYVSPNLIDTTNPYGSGWTGTTPTTSTGGGYSGGSVPGYNSSTNTIMFGYNQGTAAYVYAFNTALQNSGISITGYNYSWQYLNEGYSSGTLSATVNFAALNGTSLHSKSWTLGPTSGWTTVNGTETFVSGLPTSNISNFSLGFTGKDSRWWAGYYGPQVKNPALSLNYTFDQCATNPLSSPTCPGYAQALLNQQCTANPLYNSACPGYAQALLNQQCTADPLSNPACPSYAAAYLTYQCNINPLYSTTCPGYDQAYFDKMCKENALYSKSCPGYAEAYALKYVIISPTTTTTSTTTTSTTTTTTATTSSDGTVSVPVVKDSNVNNVITTTATSASPAQAATATVPLVSSPSSSPTETKMAAAVEQKQEKTEEKKNDSPSNSGSASTSTGNTPSDNKPSDGPKTARQELQERRENAAKAKAVEAGKNLANEMGKAASMDQQVAVQNVVIQAMGFSPAFEVYKVALPDVKGYKPYSIYPGQKTVDNRSARRMFGGTDQLHDEMVNSQYK